MSCLRPSDSHWFFRLQPLPYQTACARTCRGFPLSASAILPRLLLSIGVPALSGPGLVTVSQPRSWSPKHVCHAGGTSLMVIRIHETFSSSRPSAPGVELVWLQFCCCVYLLVCLLPVGKIPQSKVTQETIGPGCHKNRGLVF